MKIETNANVITAITDKINTDLINEIVTSFEQQGDGFIDDSHRYYMLVELNPKYHVSMDEQNILFRFMTECFNDNIEFGWDPVFNPEIASLKISITRTQKT